MRKIKGNISCTFYKKKSGALNEIGEATTEWQELVSALGVLDYISGTTQRDYKVKLEDSTHIFICNYFELPKDENDLKASIKGIEYEVIKVDNVMEMNDHYEIYLKQLGEAND